VTNLTIPFCKKHYKIEPQRKNQILQLIIKLKLVLPKEETCPTLLNTIFINETDYHNRKIEKTIHA
jgi:hypothetical protein